MEQFDDQRSGQGFGEYWAIVLRRKWWILGPLFFGWLLVFASAWVLPPRYVSESTILVEPPKVPSKLVEPNVQVDLADRVQSMSTQVLSRTRLLGLINRFHLYPTYAYSPDDQVEKMRDDVKMDLIQGESGISGKAELLAFKISYKAPRAEAAQKVTIALTSFFVDENVRASQEQSEATTLFLDSQARAVGQQLADMDAKLRAYKAEHDGTLPEQLDSNLKILSGIQQQLQAASTQRERAVQQETYLNSLQSQYESMGDSALVPFEHRQAAGGRADQSGGVTGPLYGRPSRRQEAEGHHCRSGEAEEGNGGAGARECRVRQCYPAAVAGRHARGPVEDQMKAEQVGDQIRPTSRSSDCEQGVRTTRRASTPTPAVEAEMAGMMRDYGTIKKEYGELLAKKQDVGAGHQPGKAAAGRAVPHH